MASLAFTGTAIPPSQHPAARFPATQGHFGPLNAGYAPSLGSVPVVLGTDIPGMPTTKHGQYVAGLPLILGKGVLRDPAHVPLMRCDATQYRYLLGRPIPNPDTVAEAYGIGSAQGPY